MCVGFVLSSVQNYNCLYNYSNFLNRPECYYHRRTVKKNLVIISSKVHISTSCEMEITSVVRSSFYYMVEDVF
jgi:hypothetical protein